MPVLYADIIVDISAESLDRSFEYRIPEQLCDQVEIGSQVQIPFGRGNRSISGYVINITGQPVYDTDKIKDIIQVINAQLALEGQLIKLAWQIKKAYGGTMNQALKTVIPVKKQVRAIEYKAYRCVAMLPQLEIALDKYRKDRRFASRVKLLELLADQDEPTAFMVSREELLNHFQVSQAAINGALKDGILEEVVTRHYRSAVRRIMPHTPPVCLNDAQKKVVADILNDDAHQIHLLHGITGSGKTEVYMELIARTIADGGQAIVLIPEIALSLQTVSRFYARFSDRVSVMNSRLSEGEKYDQYLRARHGDVDIVVGPRSALFMPFPNLKLIIIDEEHDGAYKSENTPKFHARDVAAWRAALCGARLILGSATPALESYARALAGMYGLHQLNVRARAGSTLPEVTVVDMRQEFKLKNKKIFSNVLRTLIEQRLSQHEQVILFLNRRGYAGFVSCRSCGHVFKCRHCEVAMTAHHNGWLKCHYCGFEQPLPKTCPECGSPYVAAFGTGTQKVEQMVIDEFPGARVLRLDRDSTAKKDSMEDILDRFKRHEADILVGTQMIVKGHDFPDVTLVGILAADLSMFSNDYMASERTFALLTQAAGRAGRFGDNGQVVIQTYNPEHYSIVCASHQDYLSFYRQEMQYRQMLHYPPVIHMMVVLVQSANEELAGDYIRQLLADCRSYCSDQADALTFIGPANAAIAKGKDVYRKVFYIKSKKFEHLIMAREFMEEHLKNTLAQKRISADRIRIQFDVNPMSMY